MGNIVANASIKITKNGLGHCNMTTPPRDECVWRGAGMVVLTSFRAVLGKERAPENTVDGMRLG